MSRRFQRFADLAHEIELPADGTLSRTLHNDDRLKVVLFGFSEGQELSEHTSSNPAIMHFLEGEADIGLGDEQTTATAGTWIHMEAELPHSIVARTPVVMLLLMLKQS